MKHREVIEDANEEELENKKSTAEMGDDGTSGMGLAIKKKQNYRYDPCGWCYERHESWTRSFYGKMMNYAGALMTCKTDHCQRRQEEEYRNLPKWRVAKEDIDVDDVQALFGTKSFREFKEKAQLSLKRSLKINETLETADIDVFAEVVKKKQWWR